MEKKIRILEIGPSRNRTKGGMATVIEQINNSKLLNEEFDIDFFESYIDTGKIRSIIFSVCAWVRFLFTFKQFDIYHIHMASNGSFFRKSLYINVAFWRGKKVIIHVHGGGFLEFYENSKFKSFILETLNKANLILVLSDNLKKAFNEILHLNNVEILSNGVETNSVKIPSLSSQANDKFCFFGKICEDKGVYDLVKAIYLVKLHHPSIKCYFCGVGEKDKLVAIIKQYNLEENCIYLGWIESSQKQKVMSSCSTLILPSYSEALPMCILEAMSFGLAIISTNVGAVSEVVRDKNGFIIEPGDVESLAETIKLILDNKVDLNEISINNIERIKTNYSLDVVFSKLYSYFLRV